MNISVGIFPTSGAKGPVDVTMNIFGNEKTVPLRLLANVIPASGGSPGQHKPGLASPNLPSKTIRLASPGASANKSTSEKDPAEDHRSVCEVPILGPTPAAADPGSSPVENASGSSRPGALWFEKLSAKEREALSSPLGFVTSALVPRKTDPEIRAPEDLSVLKTGADFLVIGWTAPKDTEVGTFEVEIRAMIVNPQSQMPESVWDFMLYQFKKSKKSTGL